MTTDTAPLETISPAELRAEIKRGAIAAGHDVDSWRRDASTSIPCRDLVCRSCGRGAAVYDREPSWASGRSALILHEPLAGARCDRRAILEIRAALRRPNVYVLTTYGRGSSSGIPARVRVWTIKRGELVEITGLIAATLGDAYRPDDGGISAGGYGYSRSLHVLSAAARRAGVELEQSRIREL